MLLWWMMYAGYHFKVNNVSRHKVSIDLMSYHIITYMLEHGHGLNVERLRMVMVFGTENKIVILSKFV